MNRRDFLLLGATALASPAMAGAAAGYPFMQYEPGMVQECLADGKTVFLDFAASWCSTCRAQGRVLDDLLARNPHYLDTMVFIRVDWDQFSDAPLTRELRIPRRSTLLVLQGQHELGRLVAQTDPDKIKSLLDRGITTVARKDRVPLN